MKGALAGKRCLVVDDDGVSRRLLVSVLSAEGARVVEAADGPEALMCLANGALDVILLDIALPRLSGMVVLKKVRESHSITRLPVLMISAQAESKSTVEALSAGANDYIVKPFDPEIVLARVRTQLALVSKRMPATSGALHRLKRAPSRPAYPRPDLFCPACNTCLFRVTSGCPECGSAMPATGWPLLRASGHEWLGRMLGDRFFVERRIGHGGTGTVFRVRDIDLKRRYAAKVMSLGAPSEEEAALVRGNLLREIDALAQLTNPHVVRINEVMELRADLFAIIMDYVKGSPLNEILKLVHRFEPREALDIARQIAQGLHEAHKRGLVHRDVKPANVMLENLPAGGYFARLLDFGIVQVAGQPHESPRVGTPRYMAPEQIHGKQLDARADIYGLGCLLFHMISGKPAHDARNTTAVIYKQLYEETPRLSERAPEVATAMLDSLLLWMMSREPEARPGDMTEVIASIDRIKNKLP